MKVLIPIANALPSAHTTPTRLSPTRLPTEYRYSLGASLHISGSRLSSQLHGRAEIVGASGCQPSPLGGGPSVLAELVTGGRQRVGPAVGRIFPDLLAP